jgi:predicted amidohydrolase
MSTAETGAPGGDQSRDRWSPVCLKAGRTGARQEKSVPVFGPHNGVVTDLRLALCQCASRGDPQANLDKGLAGCSRAADEGADIAVLPEMWQIGYEPCPDDEAGRARWQEMAIARDDPWVSAFRKAASDLNVAILTTFLERWPGSPRNTALLIDRHGQDVLCYAKVHTCDFGMEKALTPGDSFEVARLDIEGGFVDVGVMICYDREFPESARELMLGGAELILVPNACPMAGERTSQLRSRAFENMTAIATVNYSAPDQDGHSSVFDGMVYEQKGQPNGQPRDQLLFEAGNGEGVYMATLNLDALREYRGRETMGDAYRKPGAYRRLRSDEQGVPVFNRSDSRRGTVITEG